MAPSGSAAVPGGGGGRVRSGRVGSRALPGPGRFPSALTAFPLAAAGSPRLPPARSPPAAGSMAAPAGGLEDAELREAQRDYLDFLDDEVRPGAGLRWEMWVLNPTPPHPSRHPEGWGAPGPCSPPRPFPLGRWG